jgi:hypothetical protein
MAKTKFLARDLAIAINTGSIAVPVWTPIGGLNSLTHSPSTERADTTDNDSNGRAEHIVSQRGDSWSLAGYSLEDVADGTRDAGQEAVEELATAIGLSSLGQFRLTSPGGNTATFLGSAEVTTAGGGHNDAAAWSATVEVSGPVTRAAPA